jgi:protein suppressor of PHYA-105 1
MQESSVGTIKTKANVCCIQFPPDSGHLLAFGSADYKVYVYDLRTTKLPLCTLASHQKAVSYVKFVDSVTLVSASTDNTLKLWDLTRANTAPHAQTGCSLTYTGHTNEKVTALVSWCFIC